MSVVLTLLLGSEQPPTFPMHSSRWGPNVDPEGYNRPGMDPKAGGKNRGTLKVPSIDILNKNQWHVGSPGADGLKTVQRQEMRQSSHAAELRFVSSPG
jgi:hypothetical protein